MNMEMRLARVFRVFASAILTLTIVSASSFAQTQKPLEDKDNPTLIGKRDLNKGQIQFYSIEREVALGRQLAAEYDRTAKFVDDPLVLEFVNRVGQNLVLNSDAKVPFTIKVVESKEVNAFALPGGFLYVNRGLIEAADNEAELAGVLAHEIGHVAARHGMEQASKGDLMNYASIPLIFLGGWPGMILQNVAGLAVPLGFLKFSRGAEKEADRLGAQYLWAAGYDPRAMISFFEKLQANEKKKPGTLAKIFATHPMNGDRIIEVQNLIARFPERNEYQVSSSDFNSVRSRLVAADAQRRGSGSMDDAKRPTLKRRPTKEDPATAGDSSDSSSTDPGYSESGKPESGKESPDRPTLKKGPRTDP